MAVYIIPSTPPKKSKGSSIDIEDIEDDAQNYWGDNKKILIFPLKVKKLFFSKLMYTEGITYKVPLNFNSLFFLKISIQNINTPEYLSYNLSFASSIEGIIEYTTFPNHITIYFPIKRFGEMYNHLINSGAVIDGFCVYPCKTRSGDIYLYLDFYSYSSGSTTPRNSNLVPRETVFLHILGGGDGNNTGLKIPTP